MLDWIIPAGITDHELLHWVIFWGVVFFVLDAVWKIFGTQRRLNKLERDVEQLQRRQH